MNADGTAVNIRIRLGNVYDGDPETKAYRNATFAEAVAALQGEHRDGYHRPTSVHVVACYAEDQQFATGRGKVKQVKYDEPVFAQEVTVRGRELSFGSVRGCEISMGSIGSHSTEIAHLRHCLMGIAIQLADAANAEPACPHCEAYAAEISARWAE